MEFGILGLKLRKKYEFFSAYKRDIVKKKCKKYSVLRTKICTKKLEKLKKLEGFGTQWSNLLDFAVFCEILNDLLGRWMAAINSIHNTGAKSFIFHVKFAKNRIF